MKIKEANEAFAAGLQAQSGVLINEIQMLAKDLPFNLDAGTSKEAIDAIHFEYDWESFRLFAIPLNTRSGYCGTGLPLKMLGPLIPSAVESALTDAIEAEDDDFCDNLREQMERTYVAWFKTAWQAARGAMPSIWGFFSVHDTIWRMDLDSGENFREDEGEVKFFERQTP